MPTLCVRADVAFDKDCFTSSLFDLRNGASTAISVDINTRTAPIYRILVSAASSDTDAAAILEELTRQRQEGQGRVATALARAKALRPGLSAREAGDVMLMIRPDFCFTMMRPAAAQPSASALTEIGRCCASRRIRVGAGADSRYGWRNGSAGNYVLEKPDFHTSVRGQR